MKITELTENDCKLITRAAGLGLVQADIAHLLNISYSTFMNWLSDRPSVRQAYDLGRASARLRVAEKLFDKIEAGDTACILFYLKCQCGWTENKPVAQITKPTIYLPSKDETLS